MRIYCDNSLAAEIIHPGFAVADELEALGVSEAQAAATFGIARTDLLRLFDGQFDITAEIASGLERLGSAECDFWLRLQCDYKTSERKN
jgi:addiction module HigA family antidote